MAVHESLPAEASVLTTREGSLLRITLNRPRVINAFNREMVEAVDHAIASVDASVTSAIWLDGAGERGFCGGGDIKAMAGGSVADAVAFLEREYAADLRVATAPVPTIGVMDGITMGGGIGLTGHASIRIVTERSRLAMPETKIGIVPDVGGHLLLARAPGRLGELLAVTSGSMGAGDAIALGFADFFVPSDRLEALRHAVASDGLNRAPGAIVAEFAQDLPASPLLADRGWFDAVAEAAFGGEMPASAPGPSQLSVSQLSASQDPVGAAQRLIDGLERLARQGAVSEGAEVAHRAAAVAAEVRAVCPTSVAVTLAQLDRTRREQLDLAAVLADDLRVVSRLIARADFAEGVRAQVIDKDGAPKWSPARIEDLDREVIAELLAE